MSAFPVMRAQQERTMSVPAINGGINENSGIIQDNQATQMTNLWWYDGQLCTRPGIQTSAAKKMERSYSPVEGETFSVRSRKTKIVNVNDGVYVIMADDGETINIANGAYQAAGVTIFSKFGKDGTLIGSKTLYSTGTIYGSALYAPAHDGTHDIFIFSGSCIEGFSISMDEPEQIVPYAPLVIDGGKPSGSDDEPTGYLIDDYNVLTNGFICRYQSDGTNAYYRFNKVKDDSTITVKVTDESGTLNTYTVQSGSNISQTIGSIYISVNRSRGFFSIRNTSYQSYIPYIQPSGSDIELIVAAEASGYEFSPSEMTIAKWFGGDRSGLEGGTRLFMAGSSTQKNLLIWSGVNKANYFPENCYVHVGDADEKITALEQMGSTLFVFKEHSIYAVTYAQNTVTADDITNYNVVGYQSNTAYFPVMPVSPNIGCKYPQTIVLCDNRLIWYHDGSVYGMYAVNQYSERNVLKISGNVKLPETASHASASEYKQHYLLQIGTTIYDLNFGWYSVGRYTYQSNDKDAQKSMQWSKWDVSNALNENSILFNLESSVLFMTPVLITPSIGGPYAIAVYASTMNESGFTDSKIGTSLSVHEKAISFSLTTKQFDFGCPQMYKNIRNIHVEFCGLCSVGTKAGDSESAQIASTHESMRSEIFRANRIRTPNMAITLSGCGAFSLGQVSAQYTITGGIR